MKSNKRIWKTQAKQENVFPEMIKIPNKEYLGWEVTWSVCYNSSTTRKMKRKFFKELPKD